MNFPFQFKTKDEIQLEKEEQRKRRERGPKMGAAEISAGEQLIRLIDGDSSIRRLAQVDNDRVPTKSRNVDRREERNIPVTSSRRPPSSGSGSFVVVSVCRRQIVARLDQFPPFLEMAILQFSPLFLPLSFHLIFILIYPPSLVNSTSPNVQQFNPKCRSTSTC